MDAINLPGGIWPLELVSHLREHLVHMRLQDRAECTIAARRRTCVRLAEFLRYDPKDAPVEDLRDWQISLLATSKTLVRHQTALLRPYYAWLHDMGHRPDNPSRLLVMPKAKRGLPRPIAEPRLYELILTARPRLVPWFLLAGWCGLRAGEIAQLRVDSFSVDDRGAWVRVIGKNEAVRDVPIPEFAWPTIEASLAAKGAAWRRERGHGPVTPQHVSQLCCQTLHRLGWEDTLHALRHRVATMTYDQHQDIRLVQELLGHAHMSTTAIYTRVNPSRMAIAVNDLPHPPLPTPATARHLHAVDTTHGGTA